MLNYQEKVRDPVSFVQALLGVKHRYDAFVMESFEERMDHQMVRKTKSTVACCVSSVWPPPPSTPRRRIPMLRRRAVRSPPLKLHQAYRMVLKQAFEGFLNRDTRTVQNMSSLFVDDFSR